MEGRPAAFASPREASSQGIATVHQFDSTFPLMCIGRSFFVGAELTKKWGLFTIFDRKTAHETAVRETRNLGITRIDEGNRLVGGLSGGGAPVCVNPRTCPIKVEDGRLFLELL